MQKVSMLYNVFGKSEKKIIAVVYFKGVSFLYKELSSGLYGNTKTINLSFYMRFFENCLNILLIFFSSIFLTVFKEIEKLNRLFLLVNLILCYTNKLQCYLEI